MASTPRDGPRHAAEPTEQTLDERLADLVLAFLKRQHETAEIDPFKRALEADPFPDPLRALLLSYPELPLGRMGDLAILASAMDAAVRAAREAAPTSNESSGSGTNDEREAKVVAKWQNKVTAALEEALGEKYTHDIVITKTTKCSHALVVPVYGNVISLELWAKLEPLLDQIDEAMLKKLNKPSDAMPPLEAAFVAQYYGSAPARLLTYVNGCWAVYRSTNAAASKKGVYRYPYCAIVQSSGFGKSRLLRELAIQTNALNQEGKMRMHVVYACVRNITNSTGYPRRTTWLSEYLFPTSANKEHVEKVVQELAQRLLLVFEFAMSGQPADQSELLLGLFTGEENACQEAFTAFEKGFDPAAAQQTLTNQRLMLAIDEARALLPGKDEKGIGWFRVWRRALAQVNELIRQRHKSKTSGVFGIVVDTNSKIADFVPSAPQDPSYRDGDETELFSPFVLTETVDVFHQPAVSVPKSSSRGVRTTKSQQYEEEVLHAIKPECRKEATGWESLRNLGRPLWKAMSISPDATGFTAPEKGVTTQFAARKLLTGLDPDKAESLNDRTMNGVASLLCRVGLRPYASTPLATRAVADFMAVLSSVGFEHSHVIASYSSDPILTLGAARIWHAIDPPPLAGKILPELGRMMHQELVDTGNAGEMAARIVLLLAMDACGVLETGDEAARWNRAGEFCSVWTFLRALHGDAPCAKQVEIVSPSSIPKGAKSSSSEEQVEAEPKPRTKCVDAGSGTADAALKAMRDAWIDWFVSFTHFIQLAELPTEDCLWAMLGRRAAGIFPRGQKGVDLVIPICTAAFDTKGNPVEPRVSMILVQVKNLESSDSGFPRNATEGLRPSVIFKRGDTVSAKAKTFQALEPESVIRIYMSLRDRTPERFYLVDDIPGGRSSYVLCLRGLSAWKSRMEPAASQLGEVRGEDVEGKSTVRADVLDQEMDDLCGMVSSTTLGDADEKEGGDLAMSDAMSGDEDLWSDAEMRDECEDVSVEVLSAGVVEELKKFLQPWWKVLTLVSADLKARDKLGVYGESSNSLLCLATLPLAENLLLNKSHGARQGPSRLGRAPTDAFDHSKGSEQDPHSQKTTPSAPLSGSRHQREESLVIASDDSTCSTATKKCCHRKSL